MTRPLNRTNAEEIKKTFIRVFPVIQRCEDALIDLYNKWESVAELLSALEIDKEIGNPLDRLFCVVRLEEQWGQMLRDLAKLEELKQELLGFEPKTDKANGQEAIWKAVGEIESLQDDFCPELPKEKQRHCQMVERTLKGTQAAILFFQQELRLQQTDEISLEKTFLTLKDLKKELSSLRKILINLLNFETESEILKNLDAQLLLCDAALH